MKKYVVALALLLAQNVCAMELSADQECEKCLLVTKYLEKYPQGKNEEEKKKIDLFFNPRKIKLPPVRAVGVEKYRRICRNIKTNESRRRTINVLRDKIKNNPFVFIVVRTGLPVDVQKLIFAQMYDFTPIFVNDVLKQGFISCYMDKDHDKAVQVYLDRSVINNEKEIREFGIYSLL
jgi:hypothetical protein